MGINQCFPRERGDIIRNYQRKKEILRSLRTEGTLRVAELISLFSLAPATLRRDLSELEAEGKITRSHGEVSIVRNQALVLPFMSRSDINSEEKKRIAEEAGKLIIDNDSIILDSGTSALALTRYLLNKKHITVLTNSLPVSYALLDADFEVRLCGGVILPSHLSLIGPDAERFFDGIQVDLCFIGTSGIRSGSGFTTSSPFISSIKRRMIKSAKRVVALADLGKFSKSNIIEFAKFEEIDTLITSYPVKDNRSLSRLEALGTEIIYVKNQD